MGLDFCSTELFFFNLDLNIFSFLFGQVVDEIWICENETVTKWESDIFEYKEALAKKVRKQIAKMRDG